MTARVLIATDLDRTLIYSAAAAGSDVPMSELVPVENLDGRAISFMTTAAASMLVELAAEHLVVPVTTRTPEQLARVRLPGGPPRYAVAANGGVLLENGLPDANWGHHVRTALRDVAPLDAAIAELAAACQPDWAKPARVAADLFCYSVIDRGAMLEEAVFRLSQWAAAAGWTVSVQGRKVYLVPAPLTKSAAVAEVARRAGTVLTLAAGDSLLDRDLLLNADFGVRPGHGELAESGWRTPSVDAVPVVGIRAAEQILAWFASGVQCHAAGVVSTSRPTA
jgi:hypothetical protein